MGVVSHIATLTTPIQIVNRNVLNSTLTTVTQFYLILSSPYYTHILSDLCCKCPFGYATKLKQQQITLAAMSLPERKRSTTFIVQDRGHSCTEKYVAYFEQVQAFSPIFTKIVLFNLLHHF